MEMRSYKTEEKRFSSSMDIDMDKEFLYADFPALRKEDSPVYGAGSAGDVVFSPLNIDQMGYLLSSEGTHMILFGGPWSKATNSVIDRINYYARRYNVPVIHQFDFALDGVESHTIKQDITAQPGYDGPDKGEENPYAFFNYFYGEYCSRHLTNLNDWVKNKAGKAGDITYLNLYEQAVSVPNLTEPFLFIYNKDNTVNYSGSDTKAEKYPVMFAAELCAYKGEAGDALYSDPVIQNESTLIDNFDEALQEKIFRHIGKECPQITNRTKADHMLEAFGMNGRGHSIKTEPAFLPGEQINIRMINLQEFRWLLNQNGTFMLELAGPWCTFSQGSVTTINDYAVANNLRVYMADIRLDDKYQIDVWNYPRAHEMSYGKPEFMQYHFELWDNYLENAEILSANTTANHSRLYSGVDNDGVEHKLHGVGVPYFFVYNRESADKTWHGPVRHPVIASRHDSGQLINTIPNYAYFEPTYKCYKGSCLSLFSAYMRSEGLGVMAKEIEIDRTKPLAEGKEEHNTNVSGLRDIPHIEHNWYIERANRKAK